MSRLLTGLGAAAVLFVLLAIGGFTHGGTLSTIVAVAATILAVPLLLALIGLARDPHARAAVAARISEGGVDQATSPLPARPARASAPAAEAAALEAEPTQGYSVTGRRPTDFQRKQSRGGGSRRR